VVPVGFYLYVAWRNGALAPLIWGTAPYLRGTRAPFKGVVLGTVTRCLWHPGAAARHAHPATPQPGQRPVNSTIGTKK
jgi:hypothetical protein